MSIWLYSILSVFIVSLISLIGVFSFGVKEEKLRKFLIYVISFSAGALFGDAFIHLLPEVVKQNGFGLDISLYILIGILIFFVLEKIVHSQHYHHDHKEGKNKVKPLAFISLTGSVLHNFIDGIVIASTYLISIPAGIATTFAVFLHEIPHELGSFGILLHAGMSRKKAVFVNFLSALAAILGAVIALWIGQFVQGISLILVPIAAGGLIYIAGSDLIPELHREEHSSGILQLIFFILGMLIMRLLLIVG